jgi:hypothetical protein
MPLHLRRLAALLTILLSIAITGVVVLRGMGADVATGPLPSATPVRTPSASARASTGPDPVAVFAQIESQVRQMRGLPAPSIGQAQVIGRAQLETELRASFDRDYPQARRDADNLLLRSLGLLTREQDFAQLQLKLQAGQVIGFYDDKAKRMAVVTDSGVGPEVRVTYAHEYTHALQDKAFGLASLDINAVGEDDRDLARLSLVEGDATTSMLLWAIDHLTPQELLEISRTPAPDMTGIPAWMVEELEFPYVTGASFIERLYASGGWSAVDAAFRAPPASTEQVIHTDRYASREAPIKVTAPALGKAMGTGWHEAPADTLGEAMLSIWLKGVGVPSADAAKAAEGWSGDRAVAASGPDGGMVLAVRLAWDSAADATQFAAAYAQAGRHLALRSRLVPLSPTQSLVVQASTQAFLDRAVAGLR